ncbi:hypothetical protein H257_14797 [Aphanomyces astaci]|uniref:Tc1-like transposase DDE domain-containing protein n=1 Tax=Aphanomyces astaci TaxID=112090 RepID=W4FRJ4_APHAT|nr:hypothetical protein H257_14797 [Aphanomyces astaci]ETV69561.1 hypothetical protein H257_14797 [Aphanomyces astaci]|eukprot:XP_009840985.1 hypothetical protein H257_14797 [Aphanomyces astaci]
MGRAGQLTEYEQGSALAFSKAGWSIKRIAAALGRSRNVVASFIRSPETYGTHYVSRKSTKVSERARRQIVKHASTTGCSARQLKAYLPLEVSLRTYQRILNQAAFLEYTKRQHAPKLQQRHKDARLKYAEDNLTNPPDWDIAVWSDEKKFNLDGPDGLQYYWHDLRHEKDQFFTRHSSGGSCMIWAAFSSHGKSEIAFLDGSQTGDKSIDTLSNYLFPFGHEVYGGSFVFMQDNASIHCSKVVMEFLDEQDIVIFGHPALSPDLNPIENVWGVLARQVDLNGKQFDSVAELKVAIKREWENISQNYLQELIRSMPKRCVHVIQAKGGKTNPDGLQYYWHDLRKDEQTFLSRQNGEGGVMIWTGFSSQGRTEVAVLQGRQDFYTYCDTVANYLLSFVHAHPPDGFVFQQDNTSIHASQEARVFLTEQNVPLLSWPALSPDLNPIENVWRCLARKVYANGRQFGSVQELQSEILRQWDAIDEELFHKLIASMKSRCIDVLQGKGSCTKAFSNLHVMVPTSGAAGKKKRSSLLSLTGRNAEIQSEVAAPTISTVDQSYKRMKHQAKLARSLRIDEEGVKRLENIRHSLSEGVKKDDKILPHKNC